MSKETNSKDTTDKSDAEAAAKDKDFKSLQSEVGILKQYVKNKNEKEVKENKKTAEETYQKNRLSKKIIGLGGLASLSPGLGKQSFKKS